MNVLRWRTSVVLGTLALLLAAPNCQASEFDARQLVDHLYIVSGQLPIQTLIVEMEASEPIGDAAGANLRPASKDKIFFKRPNKLHVDSILINPGGPFDGKQFVIIRDGVNNWMFVTTGEYPIKKGEDLPEPTSMLPFHIQVYVQDASKRYTVIARGDKKFGPPTDVVRISDPANPKATTTVWIDRTRWVPIAQEIVKPSTKPNEPDTVKRVLYKDIRQMPDGRFFPFELEIYKNGVLTSAISYHAVGVNENLPDSLFEPMSRFFK